MTLNIIHNPQRTRKKDSDPPDRAELLHDEIVVQRLKYKLWPALTYCANAFVNIARAHKEIIHRARANGWKEVAIAEDDIHFTAPGAWQYFQQNRPADYDLYLGGSYGGTIQPDNTIKNFSCLHLYMIHERFYNHFLSLPELMNIDVECNMIFPNKKYVVCMPMVAVQHNTPSDNGGRVIDHEAYWKKFPLFTGNPI